MGLPVTKLFCVSTAVRTVSVSSPTIITGAKSCQAKSFSSLPSLSGRKMSEINPQLKQMSTFKGHVKGNVLDRKNKSNLTQIRFPFLEY